MLAALKLLAWEDRRELADDRDAEVVLGKEFDYATVGALLGGRDLRELLTMSGVSGATVQESLARILSRDLVAESDGTLAFAMAGTNGDYALNLIRAFRTGLNY